MRKSLLMSMALVLVLLANSGSDGRWERVLFSHPSKQSLRDVSQDLLAVVVVVLAVLLCGLLKVDDKWLDLKLATNRSGEGERGSMKFLEQARATKRRSPRERDLPGRGRGSGSGSSSRTDDAFVRRRKLLLLLLLQFFHV